MYCICIVFILMYFIGTGRDGDSAEMKEYRNGLNDPLPTSLIPHDSDYIYRK